MHDALTRSRLAGTALILVAVAAYGCGDHRTSMEPRPGPSLAPGTSLSVNLDQWANGTSKTAAAWQNGDLNGNNSQYAENKVVPFRLAVEGLSAGSHTIHINYDFTAGGNKAYDFLTTWNKTENPSLCSSGGGGVSLLCPSLPAPSTFPFPTDNFAVDGGTVAGAVTHSGLGAGALTIYGGTITNISTVTHVGPTGGNSTGDILVTFTSSGSSVLLAWGGHLAESAYWNEALGGSADGAGQVSGAPWHMRTQQLDGAGNKNQDRSIQPSAIVVVPPPSITLNKIANPTGPVSAGGTIGFDITVANGTSAGPATNLVISDNLPTNSGLDWSINPAVTGCGITGLAGSQVLSCTFATFAAGASQTIHVQSGTTSASCALISNTATATVDNGTIPNSTASVTVQCPSLSLAKTSTVTTVNAGDQVDYTVTVTNSGPGTATNVQISDNLPGNSGLAWSESPDNTNCSITGLAGSQVLSCTFASLAVGSASVTVVSPTTTGTCPSLSNSASASADNGSVSGSPTSAVVINVNCPPPSSGAILPTATTCEDFRDNTGPALTPLATLFAGIKGGKINNVSPGVFFYYARVTLQDNNPQLSFLQTVVPSGFPKYAVQQQQAFVYNSSCTRIATLNLTSSDTQGAATTVSASSGSELIIGIKFDPSTVVGYTVGSGPSNQLLATHTFKLVYNSLTLSASAASVELRRK